jgi:hypothetical protein
MDVGLLDRRRHAGIGQRERDRPNSSIGKNGPGLGADCTDLLKTRKLPGEGLSRSMSSYADEMGTPPAR